MLPHKHSQLIKDPLSHAYFHSTRVPYAVVEEPCASWPQHVSPFFHAAVIQAHLIVKGIRDEISRNQEGIRAEINHKHSPLVAMGTVLVALKHKDRT